MKEWRGRRNHDRRDSAFAAVVARRIDEGTELKGCVLTPLRPRGREGGEEEEKRKAGKRCGRWV